MGEELWSKLAMDDLRDTAYAYYETIDENTKQVIKDFAEQMETKSLPDKIRFEEFSAYMELNDCAQFSSKKFFDELTGEKDYLAYHDVTTLLYIIHSGRPFCKGHDCRKFIKGMYFTCVACFEKEGDYSFNLCPECFRTEKYKHDHKQFLDPVVMLRIKMQQELRRQPSDMDTYYSEPSSSNRSNSSSEKAHKSTPSSSNTIVEQNQQRNTIKRAQALQLMQIAVGFGNLLVAASQCTIM